MNAGGGPAVVVAAPAKINLSLGVGSVRDDGFHPLATVYQAVGLFDEVTVRPSAGWSLDVTGDGPRPVGDVPTDESNLAMRAGRLLAAHHGVDAGVRIEIRKGIPVAGGMAGGSADAAATLVACDVLWEARTPREDLLALAAELGSDVPFALVGGTAVGSGRGELVTPVTTRGDYWWVVLESPAGLSTPAVYREFDALHRDDPGPPAAPEVPEALLEALRGHDLAALAGALTNDLQPAALRLRPELEEVLAQGRRSSALGALVSGSGPSCLFLCHGEEHAREVAGELDRQGLGPVSCASGPAPGARVVR